MMKKKFILVGSRFVLIDKSEMVKTPKIDEYMLVNTYELGHVFLIVKLSGYHAGYTYGSIQKDPVAEKYSVRGVTKSHFIKELKRNINYKISSFKFTEIKSIFSS
ncbi:MAG TPA: hypothetical protein DEA97_14210 [Bacteroidales bacterium]|nr:MAG: hypothetical protein UR43_C0011G0009 [candidate division TM6 bacterium GW2011_GWF2_33_332]OFY78602.1 MAG: hypothetical protein A2281_16505 [Bacteroidetes bacterium RIFOXYA12_FULL_38_20]HBS87713.1 hypothetical protein [Bacteroidales bacterium]